MEESELNVVDNTVVWEVTQSCRAGRQAVTGREVKKNKKRNNKINNKRKITKPKKNGRGEC